MSDIPRVALVTREDFLRTEFRALADQCDPPIDLRTVADCREAQSAMALAVPDILLIAVAEEVIRAAEKNDLDFAMYIHEQEVGDVGALLEWVRHWPRPIKVGLFYPGYPSMVPPLILRLMGCDYVFTEDNLRRDFAKISYAFLQATTVKDRLTNRIFLSYVRSDLRYVAPICERLKRLQLNPWMDTQNVYSGQYWNPLIERAIRGADFFVPFLSHDSIQRRGVFQQEIGLALEMAQQRLPDDIYLIPALLEDCGQEIPQKLKSFHRVNMFEKDGLTRLLQAIVQGIYRLIPHGRGEKILIVDEDQNEFLRTQYELTLREVGYNPVVYDNLTHAQDAFQGGRYPVVLLDLMGGEGQQMLQALQPWGLTTKIIVTIRIGEPSPPQILPYVFGCLPKGPQFFREMHLAVHEALQALRLQS